MCRPVGEGVRWRRVRVRREMGRPGRQEPTACVPAGPGRRLAPGTSAGTRTGRPGRRDRPVRWNGHPDDPTGATVGAVIVPGRSDRTRPRRPAGRPTSPTRTPAGSTTTASRTRKCSAPASSASSTACGAGSAATTATGPTRRPRGFRRRGPRVRLTALTRVRSRQHAGCRTRTPASRPVRRPGRPTGRRPGRAPDRPALRPPGLLRARRRASGHHGTSTAAAAGARASPAASG